MLRGKSDFVIIRYIYDFLLKHRKRWRQKAEAKKSKSSPHFNKYRKDLDALGLRTSKDLERLVKSLVKEATMLDVQRASRPPENSQMKSHFGGQPYFKKGDQWPHSKTGKPMDFVFQVFNHPWIAMPDSIELIQFYYDWEEGAWNTENDGWLVKIHKEIHKEDMVSIEKPKVLGRSKYCEIDFHSVKSLPNWEGLDQVDYNAQKLSCILNEDEPWDAYTKISEELTDDAGLHSQLSGYPQWVQGDATPLDKNGEPLPLLFQIDSEEHANIMWGDSGLVYVFYDTDTDKVHFELQCY